MAERRPPRTRRGVTIGACGKKALGSAGCHGWSGGSPVSLMATLTGTKAVNDPAATNVARIVLSGTKRHSPDGALSMPAFGNAYTDDEIAAVANHVTARFGAKGLKLTAKDVAAVGPDGGVVRHKRRTALQLSAPCCCTNVAACRLGTD